MYTSTPGVINLSQVTRNGVVFFEDVEKTNLWANYDTLKNLVDLRDKRIAELEMTIEKHSMDAAGLELTIEEKSTQIAGLEQTNRQQTETIKAQAKRIQEQTAEIKERADDASAWVAKYWAKVEESTAAHAKSVDDLDTCRRECLVKTDAFKTQTTMYQTAIMERDYAQSERDSHMAMTEKLAAANESLKKDKATSVENLKALILLIDREKVATNGIRIRRKDLKKLNKKDHTDVRMKVYKADLKLSIAKAKVELLFIENAIHDKRVAIGL
jgi:hypothetical protein